jgi:hypothetical protein
MEPAHDTEEINKTCLKGRKGKATAGKKEAIRQVRLENEPHVVQGVLPATTCVPRDALVLNEVAASRLLKHLCGGVQD